MTSIHQSKKTHLCFCSVCKNKSGGCNKVSIQTFKLHKRKEDAELNDYYNSKRSVITTSIETIPETIQETISDVIIDDEQYFEAVDDFSDMDYDFNLENSTETDMSAPIITQVLPISEADNVFGNQEDKDSNDIDSDEDDDDNVENNIEDKAYFSESNSELSFIHCFIVKILVLFVSLYVVDEGAIILIAIMNKILELFRDPFHLSVSIPGLKSMAGFNTFTNGIKKYIACSECHGIYKNNGSTPPCCTFRKFGTNNLCNSTLFKSGRQSTIPKRTYVYHSVVKSITSLLSRPEFKRQINS
ncbi:hypothetical protein PHYBLDRAFT_175486 [Phycomyces blakesleeanus NRRL 1555(-)]|uniref:Uncharacterized protein n=1 Tax=Phycomyces blakesleeanus (strain ATCC 8743b / DSM 1359 / FGSC 10004 / NBRC 33097 / NRRL 1555) TaxID=763407 RepID=A0A162T4D2_PHYB8|nr:hypothetical protein PHYBLDRAFT_175486 [Phycomyces blakesleeanus NRRL 1555(-)]OAD66192.1 hypothetical protein PHYBLDRAFT_175486 [Phycomyces blakesleeanus NRRL 1555(-)]|eukprot:XP_018284232.1 hypothetical protein PHYBLDRAFT_175486 [Phycomyces blakesleeanus NRRL 1555(-)]